MAFVPINYHLLCAYWAWAEENGFRTHIRFATQAPGVLWHPKRNEPADVLSIGSNATKNLVIDANGVSCRTRIMGMELDVFIPIHAIDFAFSPDSEAVAIPLPPLPQAPMPAKTEVVKEQPPVKRSHLTVVK